MPQAVADKVVKVAPPKTEQHDKITGFCADGNHELAPNAEPRLSKKGTMFTSCRGEYKFPRIPLIICDCWCHEFFRLARQMKAAALEASAGVDITIPQPISLGSVDPSPVETVPMVTVTAPPTMPPAMTAGMGIKKIYRSIFSDPNLTEFLERFILKHTELDDPKIPRNPVAGRRERGSLDVNVEAVCRLWVDGKLFHDELTPQDISLMIDPANPPSPGAVRACLLRFAERGYISINLTPVKFLSFKGQAETRAIVSINPSKWSS
jgi:hypothetical protein